MTNSTNRGSMSSFQEGNYEFRYHDQDSRDFPPPTNNLKDHCKNLT